MKQPQSSKRTVPDGTPNSLPAAKRAKISPAPTPAQDADFHPVAGSSKHNVATNGSNGHVSLTKHQKVKRQQRAQQLKPLREKLPVWQGQSTTHSPWCP